MYKVIVSSKSPDSILFQYHGMPDKFDSLQTVLENLSKRLDEKDPKLFKASLKSLNIEDVDYTQSYGGCLKFAGTIEYNHHIIDLRKNVTFKQIEKFFKGSPSRKLSYVITRILETVYKSFSSQVIKCKKKVDLGIYEDSELSTDDPVVRCPNCESSEYDPDSKHCNRCGYYGEDL